MEQSRLFETSPQIEIGALYYDLDERRSRRVRVEAVEGEYAICRSEEGRRQSTIRVDRLASGRFGVEAPQHELPASEPANLALPVGTAAARQGLLGRLLAFLRRHG